MELSNITIIVISVMVFCILNIIENILHYSIGRRHDENDKWVYLPTYKEFIELIVIMTIFALLQGVITDFFAQYTQ